MTPLFAHSADGYVAAAYLVFLAVLLIYLAIMARRLTRISRELSELGELAAKRDAGERTRDEVAA